MLQKNKERKFGSTVEYYPCEIICEDGSKVNALFTRNQLVVAIVRAKKNFARTTLLMRCYRCLPHGNGCYGYSVIVFISNCTVTMETTSSV